MREMTKTTAKARTITGTVRVIGTENFDLVSDRFLRMADEITREYGLTIGRGVLRCVGVVSISRDLTITGLEQAETVAEKWTRALDTVSAEYGLQCEWEEQAVVERSQGVASWVENRRSIPCTVKGVQIGGVEYSPMALEKIEGAKAGEWLRAKFAQVGMSGIMGNQVRYTVEQAREREKLTAMLLKLGVDAGDVSNERLAEIHREAMSGDTPYWDSSKPDIMGNLERGMEQMLFTPTPKAAEALEKMGVKLGVDTTEMEALAEQMKPRFVDAAKAGASLRKALSSIDYSEYKIRPDAPKESSDDVKIRELADGMVLAGGADSVSHAEGIIRSCLKPRPPYGPMTGEKLAKALAAVSPTGRGGASHRNESLDIRNWGSPFETPEGAKLREHERALKAACSGGANDMSSMKDRIGDLPGVVSVRAICNELGTAVVSLWVEEGPFHYDAVKAEIEAMLPLGVELRLEAEAARMVDADMESSDAPCWTALKAPPTSYADTPTGTVEFSNHYGMIRRANLDNQTPLFSEFSAALHLNESGDILCPCCGVVNIYGKIAHIRELFEMSERGDEKHYMLKGMECYCGVRSTYDFESETIRLELVK